MEGFLVRRGGKGVVVGEEEEDEGEEEEEREGEDDGEEVGEEEGLEGGGGVFSGFAEGF